MSIPIIDQLRPLGNFPAVDASDVQAGNQRLSTVLSNTPTTTYVDAVVENKVDKVEGKGLSTNDFTNTYKSKLDGLDNALAAKANSSDVTSGLAGKVDKETGKGLSTNDYTTAEKNKLAGIEAQANKTTVDSALSTTSTNPVQNKVVKAAIDTKADASDVTTALATKADASTVSSLSSQVSTNTTNIATQTSRIDNIVALPSGSTQGDAELMDIRIKADGTTASSAGDAVREQISTLKSKLDNGSILENVTASFGGFPNLNCDENFELTKNSDHTRVSIGPFKIHNDVRISVDSSIKYQIYSCYSMTDATKYSQWASSWIQTDQIIGYNPRFADQIYFYILVGNVDDSTISNVGDVVNKISLVSENGKNPLHFIASGGWSVDATTKQALPVSPKYSSANNRVNGEISSVEAVKISANVNLGAYNGYKDIYTSENKPPMNGIISFMAFSAMVGASSFDALYSAVGFKTEKYNFKNSLIEGLCKVGVPNAKTYDSDTYEFDDINTSTLTRCLIGPFKAYDDLTITPKPGVKFAIYQLIATTSDQTLYNQVVQWQTESIIIPVNPKFANDVYYYIQVAYSNDKTFSSPYEVDDMLTVTKSCGENPNGIMFAYTWNSESIPIGHNTYTVASSVFSKHSYGDNYIYMGSDATISIRENGNETYQGITGGAVVGDGDVAILARTNNRDNMFTSFRSFDALNEFIKCKMESINTKQLTGSYAFNDPLTYLPYSVTVGESFAESMAAGTLLHGEGIGTAHTPWICVIDDTAYITFQASNSNVETDNSTSIFLAKYNLTSKTYTIEKLAGYGTYSGLSFDGACTNPYTALINGHLFITFSAHIDSEVALCIIDYNISTSNYTIARSKFEHDNVEYNFSTSNFKNVLGAKNGMKDFGYEIIISVPKKSGDYYYSAVSSGNWKFGKTAIMRTSDFVTWELYTVLPALCGSDCECALEIEGNYIYGASRHFYGDATMCVWKMNLTTKKVGEYIQIPDVAMRPTFFKRNNNIYLIHGLSNRKTIQILKLDTELLVHSYPVATSMINGTFGYNSFTHDLTDTYVAHQFYDTTQQKTVIRVAKSSSF